jgi:hypothetical protein
MVMTSPDFAHEQARDAEGPRSHVAAVRSQVRRDLRAIGLALLVYTGPFLVFGTGLLVVAAWQRNPVLAWWAVLVGGLGVFEGFFGITNRLPFSLWRSWERPAIFVALGILTVLAGLAAWLRENRG